MEKKYEMYKESPYEPLYRIRALRNFGDVKVGDVGGWIQSEHNLSHDGLCWIWDNSGVMSDSQVADDAQVVGESLVLSGAIVKDCATVRGGSAVSNRAVIGGDVVVTCISVH